MQEVGAVGVVNSQIGLLPEPAAVGIPVAAPYPPLGPLFATPLLLALN